MKVVRVLLITLCLAVPLPLMATEVLIVHSASPSFAQGFASGLRAAAASQAVDVSIEDISHSAAYGNELAALWRRQYSRADLVITLDEASRVFIASWSQRIFTRAALVALIYQPLPKPEAGWTYIGVDPNLRVSLSLIKRLRPAVRHVVLVVDPAQLNSAQTAAWLKVLEPFAPGVRVSLLAHGDESALQDELKRLGRDAAVVYAANSCGRGDDVANFNRLLRGVNVPVLGLWDTYLGHGLLGGNLLSVGAYGRFVGERLQWFKPKAGGVYHPELSAKLEFDRKILKQLHISRQRLPEAARLIGQPFVWPRGGEALGGLALVWLLTLIWAVWQRVSRRRCLDDLGRLGFEFDYVKAEQLKQQKLLDELQDEVLEGDQGMIALADSQGRIAMMNPAFARDLGCGLRCERLSDLPFVEGWPAVEAAAAGGRWSGYIETVAGVRFWAELRSLPTVSGLAAYSVLQLRSAADVHAPDRL